MSQALHLVLKLKAKKEYNWHLMVIGKRGCKNKIVIGLSHQITKFSSQFFGEIFVHVWFLSGDLVGRTRDLKSHLTGRPIGLQSFHVQGRRVIPLRVNTNN